MKKIFFLIAIALFLPLSFFAQTKTDAKNIFANSYENVNDFENILTAKQIQTLNTTLKASEAKTGHKIIIITISETASYKDLTKYSADLDKYLHISLKIDPSILIIVSKELRQIQILGADKTTTKLSNQEIENLISTYVIPELKKGDYFKGLQDGTSQLIKKLES